MDIDKDGRKDIVAAGNLYQSERETTRADASYGIILKNNGNLKFTPLPWTDTGWFVPGDVRDLELIEGDDAIRIIVASNNSPLRSYRFNPVVQ